MRLHAVRPHELEGLWPDLKPFVADVTGLENRIDPEDIYADVEEGRRQLWIAEGERVYAVASSEVVNYPKMRVLKTDLCSGHEMPQWIGMMEAIEEFGRSMDCKASDVWGRRGWQRVLPGYRLSKVKLEKAL